MIAPLCIIQARYHSTRLPGKMLLTLQGETLIARAWRVACEAFGAENCVVAMPSEVNNAKLIRELARVGATFTSDPEGHPWDVLGRLVRVLDLYDVAGDRVVVRYTPDDWRKDATSLRRVADGEVLPVEMGGERFTAAAIRAFHAEINYGFWNNERREHIGNLLSPRPAPPDDGLPWSVDTQADYDAAVAAVGK